MNRVIPRWLYPRLWVLALLLPIVLFNWFLPFEPVRQQQRDREVPQLAPSQNQRQLTEPPTSEVGAAKGHEKIDTKTTLNPTAKPHRIRTEPPTWYMPKRKEPPFDWTFHNDPKYDPLKLIRHIRNLSDLVPVDPQLIDPANVKPVRTFESINICMSAHCHERSGTGSKLVAYSMLHYLSQFLGYRYYLQSGARSTDRATIADDEFQTIFRQDLYFPKKCDLVFSAFGNWCFNHNVYGLTSFYHFETYHVLMTQFLEYAYRQELRDIATLVLREIQATHSSKILIGTQARTDALFDERYVRHIGKVDYEEFMEYYTRRFSIDNVLFVAMGDQAVDQLQMGSQYNMLFLEKFISTKTFPNGKRYAGLAAQFIGMDVSSRLSYRIVNKYSNTYFMSMAFHHMNKNTRDIEVADAFSMRIYSYDSQILSDFNHRGRYNAAYWESLKSPYNTAKQTSSYINRFARCWTAELNNNQWNQTLNPCQHQYVVNEVESFGNLQPSG